MPISFSITYPGSSLELATREESWKVEGLLRHAELALLDATIALDGFTKANAMQRQPSRDAWEAERERRREIEAVVRQRLNIDAHDTQHRDQIDLEVARQLRVETSARGEMPEAYVHRLPFFFARAFVNALDTFRKTLSQLKKFAGVKVAAGNAAAALDHSLPKLAGVRDSVAHSDERTLGQVKGKPLKLQRVVSRAINAPNGGVLISDMLNGDNFGCTTSDGHYAEVPVTPQTLRDCEGILQDLVNALRWVGPAGLRP